MIDQSLISCDNGVDKVVDADATLVAKEYYTSYSKYVLEYRALPSVYDGLKPVQRRIIYTMNQFPQKLMKTAKAAGAVMAYHPHGSSSIEGSINDMAHPLNVFPMFKTKGNFGGVGFGASASRYTECYLSEVARQNFCQFIDSADYEIGEIGEQEPAALPTLVPYCLFKGSEGIGVGLSTKVMPLNLLDIIDYYIDIIKNGKSSRLVKPDVGSVILEMTDQEIKDSVSPYRGRITVSSVVTQISSNAFLLEGIYDRSVDAVISKIDKWYGWFSKDQVGFRDASTSSAKYVFEIYDSSVNPSDLKEALVCATRRSGTYNRVVEEDGCAIYSSLNYIVKKSLEYLNKAIDTRISNLLTANKDKLLLYTVLDQCKSSNVFDNITQMTQSQLVDLIVRTTNCPEEVAWEITKKPISYLTKSHDKEIQDIKNQITDLENHDRKSYLIKLYKDFRRAVLPFYEQKKHTITQGMVISNPCIKLEKDQSISVTDGDGIPFDSLVYFVLEDGSICKRTISATTTSSIVLDVDSPVVGVVTDKSSYADIFTEFSEEKNYYGRSIVELDKLKYDKRVINLREDYGEKITKVEGLSSVDITNSRYLSGTRISKTSWIKKEEI